MARMDKIEQLLLDRYSEDDGQEEEEPLGVMGQIQNHIVEKLKDPETMKFLMGKVIGLIGSFTGAKPAAAMNGQTTPLPNDQAYMALADDQKAALDRAMGILLNGDPKIGTNLEKLAKILATDPGKYAGLAAMI
jgi:hypothetical protein